ncbi:MAG TPA: hypothetical protein VN960_05605 [Gaiellaceae bacterium]|nr:hypothetical protein [Gaiellaceae bacterium]
MARKNSKARDKLESEALQRATDQAVADLAAARAEAAEVEEAVEEAESADGRDFATGAPAPGATSEYDKWLTANGLGDHGFSMTTPREKMLDLYRAAERRRENAKHAPTEKSREKARANADAFEAQADAIRQTLPEFQPFINGDPILRGPSCPYCDVGEFPDASALWDHRLNSCPHP